MNLSEHPLAIRLTKKIKESEADCVPVMLVMPIWGQMMGSVRLTDVPGVFTIAVNTELKDASTGRSSNKVLNHEFTADKPASICFPDLEEEPSRIKLV